MVSRYGVTTGDTLYPVSVVKGELLVVGGMVVDAIVPWWEYVARHFGVDEAWLRDDWRAVAELHRTRPEGGHRLPWGCMVEAVTGRDGAELSLDRVVPADVGGNLFFVARNGKERQLRHVADGRVTSSSGLQGHVFRLRPDCAAAFRSLTWPRLGRGGARGARAGSA